MPKPKAPAAPQPPARRTIAGEDEFRIWLRAYCEALGFKAVARKTRMSPSQLSNIVAGRASLGPTVVARFGFQRLDTVTFVPTDSQSDRP